MGSTALRTDRYELTMLEAALRDGTAARRSVFEVFARRLPEGRRYGVVAGLPRVVEAVRDFRFGPDELAWLERERIVGPETLRWLAAYRFGGELHAYREGEVHIGGSPVLTVVAPFAEAVLLETVILSILNHDSAVASAAARMVAAARGRRLLEFGARRAHEEAAVAASRAAYLVGFDATSNLEAGRRYGIPTAGTAAHAFTLLHDDEPAAFTAQVAAAGPGTTLLIDTYDTARGLDHALAAAGADLGGVRIDSGDLAAEARRARARLDAAGATSARIVLSGDLDEFAIDRLTDVPVDTLGVGTSVVTGSGAPTAGFVYKLVAREATPGGELVPVAKAGSEKATVGRWKVAARALESGVATAELLRPAGTRRPEGSRALQIPVLRADDVLTDLSLAAARDHHRAAVAELPAGAREVGAGPPCLPLVHLEPAELPA